MAFSQGKGFRRLLAQALAADQREMRALFERVLPRGEGGARGLRLTSEEDRRAAPLAIVAALSADAITGDQAEKLLDQVSATSARTQREEAMARWEAEEGHKPPPERRPIPWGIDPLADAFRSDGLVAPVWKEEAERLAAVHRRLEKGLGCDATKGEGDL